MDSEEDRARRVSALQEAYTSGTLDLTVRPDHPGMELLLEHLRVEADSCRRRTG